MKPPQANPARVLRARTLAGLTQSELADLTGISERQIRRYETGDQNLRGIALRKVARATRRSTDWFYEADQERAA